MGKTNFYKLIDRSWIRVMEYCPPDNRAGIIGIMELPKFNYVN